MVLFHLLENIRGMLDINPILQSLCLNSMSTFRLGRKGVVYDINARFVNLSMTVANLTI